MEKGGEEGGAERKQGDREGEMEGREWCREREERWRRGVMGESGGKMEEGGGEGWVEI